MPNPKRKPEIDYLTAPALLSMMAQLATSKFFEIIVYGPDDYVDLEDMVVNQLGKDPSYLQGFARVMECAILLDSHEYQALVTQLCGDKEFARKTVQFIQCIQFKEDEICIINLFRSVTKRLKPTPARRYKKPGAVTKEKAVARKAPQAPEAPPEAADHTKELEKLNKLLKKAIRLEDYREAAVLQKRINDLTTT